MPKLSNKKSSAIYAAISIASVFLLLFLISGCGQDKTSAKKESNKSITTPKATYTGVTETTSYVTKVAVVDTNRGKIVIQLFPHKAPKTVENFIKLANEGFYKNMRWHRVEPGYVIQTGDPLSRDSDPKNDGLGGPGYTIPLEASDVPHVKGMVGMAHNLKDPNSGGSQFYITLDTLPHLDGRFTVFGKVIEGMDVVESIKLYDVVDNIKIEDRKL